MDNNQTRPVSSLIARAYYSAGLNDFRITNDESVIAALVKSSPFTIETSQRDAWLEQIKVMRATLSGIEEDGVIAFEFNVPRMGKRADVLLVLGAVIHVLEFKVGASDFAADALRQAGGVGKNGGRALPATTVFFAQWRAEPALQRLITFALSSA